MNTSKLADIAEIASSLAIVLTLIYLAIQTNQNTQAIQSASRQEILNAELWLFDKVIENPELGFSDESESLLSGSDLEHARKQTYLYTGFFRIRENLWLQYQNEVIDDSAWNSYGSTFVTLLSQRGSMRGAWDRITSRGGLDRDFVDEINQRLVERDQMLVE